MAERTLYEILLQIKAESGPEVAKCLEDLGKRWAELGVSIEAVNKRLAMLADPEKLRFIKQSLEMLSGPYAKVGLERLQRLFGEAAESTKEFEDEQKKLAEAEKEVTGETERQGGALSGLIQDLRDVAKIAAGIVIGTVIIGTIKKVWELAGALKDMAVGFVKSTKDVNEQMELYGAQLHALLGGAREAAGALAYISRMAITTPFFGVAELAEGIRLLTAFGLNYQRWMPVVASTAVATASSIQQIANAFGQIAAGATTRGLYYLKIAGINVRDAGIEFDKSGQAIGSTQEILEKLEAYLRDRYGDLLPEIAHTWRGSIEAMRDMWYQFRWQLGLPSFEIARDKLAGFQDWLSENQDNILAFAYVLGEYPARALQRFLDFIGEVTGQIDFQAQDFFRGAVNLMVSFADGLLTGLERWILPAIVGIADLVASFLLGTSPPPRGPLSRVYEGAVAVMRTYLLALKEGVDFQTLNEIAGFIQSALSHVWAIEELPEEQLYDAIIRARMLVAQAIGEMRTMGAISPDISGQLAAMLGPIYQEVQKYLALLGQLQAATDAVTAAQQRLTAAQERLAAVQAWVEEATKRVQEAQDRLRRFELETAEIPERFTRGRRRQLELAIQEAEEERRRRQEAVKLIQEQVRAAQEQVKAAQEQQRAVQDQISLQRAYLSELERIWKLQEQQRKAEEKAQEEEQQAWSDTKVALSDVGTKLDELKEKWRTWFAEEIDPILRRLEDHWTRLGDFIKGFIGITVPGPYPGMIEPPTEAWKEGSRFRTALDTIIENLDKIPARMREIMEDAKKIALIAGGVWLVLQGFKLLEGLVWTAALAKALGISAAAVVATATGILLPVALALTITGLAVSGALPEPVRNVLYTLFPNLEVAAITLGTDTGNTVVQAIVDRITGRSEDTEEAADEGFVQPILRKARELWDELVGRSIFPDMIREIIDLFRGLPWKLFPYLVLLYTTISTWITLASTTWTLELTKMQRSADDLIRSLENLIRLLERLRDLLRDLGIRMPTSSLRRHAGGPIFHTGQYQLEAGEYVLSRERATMAGMGAGALGSPIIINQENYWPEGVDRMKRRELEKLVKKGALEAFTELMHKSGRD